MSNIEIATDYEHLQSSIGINKFINESLSIGYLLNDSYYLYLLDSIIKRKNPKDNRVIEYSIRRKEVLEELAKDKRITINIDFSEEKKVLIHSFIFKVNYRYNEIKNKIEFDNESIVEVPNHGFVINGKSSTISNFYNRNLELLNELFAIESKLYELSQEVQEDLYRIIDNDTNLNLNILNIYNKPIGGLGSYTIRTRVDNYNKFISYYSADIDNLVKWLNKLNEEDVKELAEELIKELNLHTEEYEKLFRKLLTSYSPNANELIRQINYIRTGSETKPVIKSIVFKNQV